MFSGVGKTRGEMRAALEAGIHQFNVESEPELRAAERRGDAPWARARRSRLRINPDVDAQHPCQDHHRHGGNQVRHSLRRARGMPMPMRPTLPGIRDRRRGCSYRQPDHRTGAVRDRLHAGGELVGDPARRRPRHRPRSIWAAAWACHTRTATCRRRTRSAYGAMVARVTRDLGCTLSFEPGRLIAANAGVLVARVHLCETRRRQGIS